MNKKSLLTLGFLAFAWPNTAQEHHHHGPNYEISVFYGTEQQAPINLENKVSIESAVATHFPNWSYSLDPITGVFSHLYGPAKAIDGSSMEAKALSIIPILTEFGLEPAQWKKVRDHAAPRAHYVDFVQEHKGREVVFTKLSFQFTLDGRILKISNRSFGSEYKQEYPKQSPDDILNNSGWRADLEQVQVEDIQIDPNWIWFPVPVGRGYELRPTWVVTLSGTSGETPPVNLIHFIDGEDGTVLYRTNTVKTMDFRVRGSVYKSNAVTPATIEPLVNMEVTVNGSIRFSDDEGKIYSTPLPASATLHLRGPWSTVIDAPTQSTPSYSATAVSGSQVTFASPSNMYDGHVNAFYHVNRIHEVMKKHLPDFFALDYSLPTRVDLGSGSCNAFYNGSSINFYAASGNCRSFAEIGDIVYHEYGHGIAGHFYGAHGSGRMFNGALNEGYADIWGIMITKDSVLGRGAFHNPNSSIRRYDINPKVYPENIVGEVHGDGEIIAGAWWDFARNVGSYDTMARVFGDAYYDLVDGPNGMEGRVFHQALIAALLADDNDNDINNGTPHFREILSAFAKHGIYLYGQTELVHKELDHQAAGQDIPVSAKLNLSSPVIFQQLKLIYKNREVGIWDTVAMADQGGYQFSGTIPAQAQGSIIEYFFLIEDSMSLSPVTYPAYFTTVPTMGQRSSLPYQFAVGVVLKQKFDFDTPVSSDWQIGTTSMETATKGNWIQARPVQATYTPPGGFGGFISQPGSDMSGTGMCMVTGNALLANFDYNSADVANGRTVLVTPKFDLNGYINPVIEYYRWFSNDLGPSNRANDPWRVELRYANTVIPRVIENTYRGEREWRRKVFTIDEYFPGARDEVELRFIASDLVIPSASNNGQSNVEALVDNFFIYDAVTVGVETMPILHRAKIYPNPSDGLSMVEFSKATNGVLSLSDMSGKVLFKQNLDKNQSRYEIRTDGLAPGVYMISIQTEKTIQVEKLIVR